MIPLADIKTWLGVTGNADDALLTALEKQMVALAESWSGRYLGEPKEFIEILNGGGRERLWLRQLPIGSVAVESRAMLTGSWEAVQTSEIETDGRVLHRIGLNWPTSFRNVRVTYQAGIDPDEIPELEKYVILELIARAYRGRGSEGVQSRSVEGVEVVYRPYKEHPEPLKLLSRRALVA